MKIPKKFLLYLFILLAISFVSYVLTLYTSTYTAVYPQTWAKQITTTVRDCPDLSGLFINKGEEAETNRFRYISPIFLGQELMPDILFTRDIDPKWATEVELAQQGDEKLTITLWEKENMIFQTVFEKGVDYECSSPNLVIKETYSDFSEYGPGMDRVTTYYGSAQDGSIIVKSDYLNIETMFFVLVGAERTVEWYRFMPRDISQPNGDK